jgi:dipeptidyl aminopeptidase/acylaminoacyl peptidase
LINGDEKPDPMIHLCDTVSRKESYTLRGHEVPSYLFSSFSHDGKLLASTSNDGIRLWNVAAGKELHRLKGNGRMAFSHDDSLLATYGKIGENSIHLCEVATGKELRSWISRRDLFPQFPMVFSPDGKLLASIGEKGTNHSIVSLWAIENGKQILELDGNGFIECLDFSPSGRVLAAAVRNRRKLTNGETVSNCAMQLWDIHSGQEIRHFDSPQGYIWSLAFSPHGQTLATGGADSTIMLWDMADPTATKSKAGPIADADLDRFWYDLASDAAQADRGIWALMRAPQQSLPFLKQRLLITTADAQQVAKLIADLDSNSFAVRQQAGQTLEKLGETAEGAVRKTLAGDPTLEVRKRLDQFLEKRSTEVIRKLRAIEALEHIGTPEARSALEAIASGAPNPRVAKSAFAAFKRFSVTH